MWRTMAEPMKPAPPVTSICMGSSLLHHFTIERWDRLVEKHDLQLFVSETTP
jgi:hypothetical protein